MENDISKIYFSINEVANKLNISTALIRFWEKELNLTPPIRKGIKKIRKYKQHHIDNLQLVKKLIREDKYTIQGVKNVLKQKSSQPKKDELLNNLKEIKNFFISLQTF